MIHGEIGVVELGAIPRGSGVAGLTGRREVRGSVVRIIRVLIIGFVTRITVRRKVRVVIVHMTTRARHGLMGAGKGKRRFVMVER